MVTIVADSAEAAHSYFEKNRLPFPCLADPKREIYRPGLFIIDLEGIVRYAHVGSQQWGIPGIDRVLEECRACAG